MRPWHRMPALGCGLGFRREAAAAMLAACDDIPVVEVLADAYLGGPRRDWAEVGDLGTVFALLPHGVSLSLASTDFLADERYLAELERFVRRFDFPYYSEHFAFTKSGGVGVGHLSPVWLTRAQLRVFCRNVRAVQSLLGRSLVLENIASPLLLPGGQMSEAGFLNETVQRTGCGLLLDLENVHINAENHGFSARGFLRGLDLDAVAQIHLAGGRRGAKLLIDSHSRPVPRPVWELLEFVVPRAPNLKAVVIERDDGLGDIPALVAEVRRASRVFKTPRRNA